MHLKTVIPQAVIIDNLSSYYAEDNFEKALISASLLESIRYCGENQKGPVYLSVGVSTTKKESTSVLEMFFNNIWHCDNEGTLLTQQPNFLYSDDIHQFEFAKVDDYDDGELKLERVFKIYHPV